jgi:hypothetical protein
MTNPSDYIKLDDEHFIYARWDVEFSGRMWVEVISFFGMTSAGFVFELRRERQPGLRDAHGGTGKVPATRHTWRKSPPGDKEPPMASLKGKGARFAYRPQGH